MTGVANVTVQGIPRSSKTWSLTLSAPIVLQPSGVAIGVSTASAFPIDGRPAMTTMSDSLNPLVIRSRSWKPVAIPTTPPPAAIWASIRSIAGLRRSYSRSSPVPTFSAEIAYTCDWAWLTASSASRDSS